MTYDFKLCKFNKNGSVTLSGAYLNYRSEGGTFSPEEWNNRVKELMKEMEEENKNV